MRSGWLTQASYSLLPPPPLRLPSESSTLCGPQQPHLLLFCSPRPFHFLSQAGYIPDICRLHLREWTTPRGNLRSTFWILLEGFPSEESLTLVFTPFSIFLCASPRVVKVCWGHSLGLWKGLVPRPGGSMGQHRKSGGKGRIGKRRDILSLGPVWCRPGVSLA